MGDFGNVASESATGEIEIYPAFDGGNPAAFSRFIHRNDGNNIRHQVGGDRYETKESINRFKLYFNTGNIATLNYQLYAYRKAI